jgi:hypothetical protein
MSLCFVSQVVDVLVARFVDEVVDVLVVNAFLASWHNGVVVVVRSYLRW